MYLYWYRDICIKLTNFVSLIRCSYNMLHQLKKHNIYTFVDPNVVSHGVGQMDKCERNLLDRLEMDEQGQLYFILYNIGYNKIILFFILYF